MLFDVMVDDDVVAVCSNLDEAFSLRDRLVEQGYCAIVHVREVHPFY